MSQLILIQNSWRINDNPMLAQNHNISFLLVGNINQHFLKNTTRQPNKSNQYIQFAIDSAIEFQKKLKQQFNLDCPLFLEDPLTLVKKILAKHDIQEIMLEQPIGYNEHQLAKAIGQSYPKIKITLIWTNSLYTPSQLNLEPAIFLKSFSHFRRKIEKKSLKHTEDHCQLKASNQKPYFVELKPLKALPRLQSQDLFKAGETAALERIEYYFFLSHKLQAYKQTRNQLLGLDYSSKLSPWLAHGAISPRTVIQQICRYETTVHENESTYWLKFELLWREFFRHAMLHHNLHYFIPGGISEQKLEVKPNSQQFTNWCQGETDNDFINANMIELNVTGYMSNRGRQNVASYLVHDLKQDWRWGAAYFETKLIDYDVSSNWCNWAYIAGVGNDPRCRKFNIHRQQQMYDPEKKFIDHWLQQKR